MLRTIVIASLLTSAAWAASAQTAASRFVFATPAEGRVVVGARDDFVRATTGLERAARLRTRESVDEERFVRSMEDAVLDWGDAEKRSLGPLLPGLERFLGGIRWQRPARILLLLSDASMEEDSPHTRANAIVLPRSVLQRAPGALAFVMAHETFHVLSRENHELREALYAAIGFRRCERVELPASIAGLRITNPDAVESLHAIAVRYRGEPVEALPYIRFPLQEIDPKGGLMQHLQVAWLLVDREGAVCRARIRGPDEAGIAPQEFQGLSEQIGRNTDYLIHPEEILADNFAQLYLATLGSPASPVASPGILARMRGILFQ